MDGTILEIPTERWTSALKDRLFQGAYPIREYGGFVFAYMGPPNNIQELPIYGTFEVPGYHLELSEPPGISNIKPCNRLQIMASVVDPVHEAFPRTTTSGTQFFDKIGKAIDELADVGELSFEETPIGILTQGTRRVQDMIWVRSLDCVAPNIAQVGRAPVLSAEFVNGERERVYVPLLTRWRVPVDDENTMEFAFVRNREGQIKPYFDSKVVAYRTNCGDRSFDEKRRSPGDYDAQVSQRAISRHGLESLVSADGGVTTHRHAQGHRGRVARRGSQRRFALGRWAHSDLRERSGRAFADAVDRRLARAEGRGPQYLRTDAQAVRGERNRCRTHLGLRIEGRGRKAVRRTTA